MEARRGEEREGGGEGEARCCTEREGPSTDLERSAILKMQKMLDKGLTLSGIAEVEGTTKEEVESLLETGCLVNRRVILTERRVGEMEKELTSLADDYLCPISQTVMRDPVITQTGHTYERVWIERWLETKNIDPTAGEDSSLSLIFAPMLPSSSLPFLFPSSSLTPCFY